MPKPFQDQDFSSEVFATHARHIQDKDFFSEVFDTSCPVEMRPTHALRALALPRPILPRVFDTTYHVLFRPPDAIASPAVPMTRASRSAPYLDTLFVAFLPARSAP